MKKSLLVAFGVLTNALLFSQIRLSLVDVNTHQIWLRNYGATPVDVSSYMLSALTDSVLVNDTSISLLSLDYIANQNEIIKLSWNNGVGSGFQAFASDISLYKQVIIDDTLITYPLIDFMQYGAAGQGLESLAVSQGLWGAGDFLSVVTGTWSFGGNAIQNGIAYWQISGCSVSTACNYSSSVVTPVNSLCTFPGCLLSDACNYNPLAGCPDNSTCQLAGCNNPAACNYDANVVCQDNSCVYPGCNIPGSCNYDPEAGCDDGSCIFFGCTDVNACNFDSEAGCNDGSCTYPGCNILYACNYNSNAGCNNGSCIFPGCTDTSACNYNPNAGCQNSSCYYSPNYLDCAGNCINDTDDNGICDEFQVAGCANPEACNYNLNALQGSNYFCVYYGCTNPAACNYDSSAYCNDGSCEFPLQYLTCEGSCINDIDSNDVCDELEIIGCTDTLACNYNAFVTDTTNSICGYSGCTNFFACNYNDTAYCNDGSCLFDGCNDEIACNYNPNAGCIDPSSCLYTGCNNVFACNYDPQAGCNLLDECVFPGCTDSLACNYDAFAGCDDGSCEMQGCTDIYACNYDAAAGCDNNTCVFPGCTDSLACNYEPSAGCDDGSCQSAGCTDVAACNYDVTAGCDNNTCLFPGCLDSTKCNYNPSAGCDNGSCIQFCCNDPMAANYLLPSFSVVDCYYSPEIIIFHDEDADGSLDDDELGLPNRPVSVAISGTDVDTIIIFSNGSGHIEYLFNAGNMLTISLQDFEGNLWSHVDPNFVSATIGVSDTLYLPLVPLDTLAYTLTAFDGLSDYIDCTNGYHGGVIFNNGGGDTLDVIMTADISELLDLGFELSLDDYFETISPLDSVDGILTWQKIITPGQIELLTFNLLGPGADIGNVNIQYNIQVNDGTNHVINRPLEIYCGEASDGGLIANPAGIYEPNFVLVGDEILYVIQFNYDADPSRFDECSGDSVAYRVLTSDTVDGFSMELNSIQPVANSHESVCSVTMDELADGRTVVNFDFTGINLRADTVDGMASSGYAIIAVQLLDNIGDIDSLEIGDQIMNDAQTLFFDSTGCNPDGVVMSYFHTIFGCDFYVPESLELCEGPATSLIASDPYADYYQWTSSQGTDFDSVYSFAGLSPGDYEIEFVSGNSLCSDTNQFVVTLNALPEITSVPVDISTCEGDSVILTVESASSTDLIEWDNGIVNGEVFYPDFNTSATFVVTDIVNDSVSCSISGTVLITLGDIPAGSVSYDDSTNTYTAPDGVSWQWYLNDTAIVGANAQTYVGDSSLQGLYSVVVTSADGCEAIIMGMQENVDKFDVQVFPNPMSNETTVVLPEGVFEITLYDLSGRVVIKRASCTQREVIHRGNLSAGCYQLHIFSKNGGVVRKLIID